jgi:transcriptional regulator with XRE-family HTH domain
MVILSKIDQIMTARGITNTQLAEMTGLSGMMIGNTRRGKNITLRSAFLISQALGEPLDMIWSIRQVEDEKDEEGAA